jgi:hypothetical protein
MRYAAAIREVQTTSTLQAQLRQAQQELSDMRKLAACLDTRGSIKGAEVSQANELLKAADDALAEEKEANKELKKQFVEAVSQIKLLEKKNHELKEKKQKADFKYLQALNEQKAKATHERKRRRALAKGLTGKREIEEQNGASDSSDSDGEDPEPHSPVSPEYDDEAKAAERAKAEAEMELDNRVAEALSWADKNKRQRTVADAPAVPLTSIDSD